MPGQEALDEVIRRIVQVSKPEKVILFGSAVRGEAGPHSDFDLLVIKSGANRLDEMGRIYRALYGVGVAVDVIVATPEDVERYGASPALVALAQRGRPGTVGRNDDKWHSLGTYYFEKGREPGRGSVTLNAAPGKALPNPKFEYRAYADAVRFVFVGE